jgi:hypothetical protein
MIVFRFTVHAECQGCDVISALSAGYSSAVHRVLAGDTVKQTWVSSNMILCP